MEHYNQEGFRSRWFQGGVNMEQSARYVGIRWSGVTVICLMAAGLSGQALQASWGGGLAWRPEAGVLAGLLLIAEPRWTLWILGATLPCGFLLQQLAVPASPAWVTVLSVLIRVATAGLGVRCFRRNASFPPRFDRLGELYCLILFLGVGAAGLGALAEAFLTVRGSGLISSWMQCWGREALGYLTLTPAVVCAAGLLEQGANRWNWRKVVLTWVLLLLTGGSAWFAFRASAPGALRSFPLAYLPFPALVWAALRFGPGGAASTSILLASVMFLSLPRVGALGPSRSADVAREVAWVQLYLLISSGMALLLAVAIREREKAVAALEESQRRSRALAENLRQTEHDVQKTEDLYRRAIAAANAVPYLRDYRTDRFVFMGDGIRELTGYPAAEMTVELWNTLTLESLMRGETAGLSYEEAVRRTRAGEFRHWQSDSLIVTREEEHRWISDSSVEILDKEGVPIGSIGILMDVTERKKAEDAVRRINVGLEGRIAERTAELELAIRDLEAFTYSVSHDLRAPLRAIEGFSRILQEDHGSTLAPEALGLLARVRFAAVKMDLLISNLLSFSRLNRQPMSRHQTDVNTLVREAFQELRLEQQGRTVRIEHHDLPSCHGDPDLLRQVWLNLISNSLKYTRKREIAEIQVGFVEENQETVYFVRDNGAGFDMAYSDKLFGVFQRLHHAEDYEGIGVGLAVAQRIIRRHGGRMWARSAVNEGATFSFTVPSRLPNTSLGARSTSQISTDNEPSSHPA
jgi:C4-dicarboxylate-specific signal transduction histidine kinase